MIYIVDLKRKLMNDRKKMSLEDFDILLRKINRDNGTKFKVDDFVVVDDEN